ncbi:MAG TPA: RNA polymerase sigma factor [Candidatus Saccharimonadales bacterium]|nr:RNA polymerase sigma factor [Candidatus Saccharimonadales bacterium]
MPIVDPSDAPFSMESLKEGRAEAWEAFIKNYNGLVWAAILRTGGFTADQEYIAKEISQDVFLAFIGQIHQLKNPSQVKGWVYRIAVNTTINWIRFKKREQKVFVDPPVDLKTGEKRTPELVALSDPLRDLIGKEDYARIESCLEKLRESPHFNWWEIIVRRCLNNMEFSEIAEDMHVSQITVRTGLSKARKLLWNCIFGEQNVDLDD